MKPDASHQTSGKPPKNALIVDTSPVHGPPTVSTEPIGEWAFENGAWSASLRCTCFKATNATTKLYDIWYVWNRYMIYVWQMKTANIVSTVGHMCNIGQYCTIYIYCVRGMYVWYRYKAEKNANHNVCMRYACIIYVYVLLIYANMISSTTSRIYRYVSNTNQQSQIKHCFKPSSKHHVSCCWLTNPK